MSRLTDLVVAKNPKILQLLSVCNLSDEINQCDIPFKKVIFTKVASLLTNI